MIQRCHNPNNKDWDLYGGRGINVCVKWQKFEGFLEDMGIKPFGLELDRKDSELGYYKENCRWATRVVQNRNRRNVRLTFEKAQAIRASSAKPKTLAKEYGVSVEAIRAVLSGRNWKWQ